MSSSSAPEAIFLPALGRGPSGVQFQEILYTSLSPHSLQIEGCEIDSPHPALAVIHQQLLTDSLHFHPLAAQRLTHWPAMSGQAQLPRPVQPVHFRPRAVVPRRRLGIIAPFTDPPHARRGPHRQRFIVCGCTHSGTRPATAAVRWLGAAPAVAGPSPALR